MSAQPFRVVVADPPWPYSDQLPGGGRGTGKIYKSQMTMEQICWFLENNKQFKIADDAVLFLWRVGPMARDAFDVAKAWGFDVPQREIVWVKTAAGGSLRIGMGRIVRNAHEVCMIATRGKVLPLAKDHGVPSVFAAPVRHHSAKPDAFYHLVERLFPGPYLELFARKQRPNWTAHGDELPIESSSGNR